MEYNSFIFSNYLFKRCSDKSSISCLLAVSSADSITFLSLLLIKSPVQFQSLLKLILSSPCSLGLSNDLWILEAEIGDEHILPSLPLGLQPLGQ